MPKTNYSVQGTSILLKRFANVHDTTEAIQRIVAENYQAVESVAQELQASTDAETFKNIWDFVRQNIEYQKDAPGIEQLRTPQRTLQDKTGDCDDMSILISSLLFNLKIKHELIVAAYKSENEWQHIYPVAYDKNGQRYVIDCVPEIPHFNYEAHPIINKIIIHMKLEELNGVEDSTAIEELTEPFNLEGLGQADTEDESIMEIQGLLGNVAIVDEDEDYDTVLSGSELQRNIILRQLVEAKNTLKKELHTPGELTQFSNPQQEIQRINAIIDNFDDEEALEEAIQEAQKGHSVFKNFYKTVDYALKSSLNGLAGEDEEEELFYLKVMDDNGMLDQLLSEEELENIDGLGELGRGWFKRMRKKIRKGVSKFKKKFPVIQKIGRALKKYSPTTFAVRRSIEIFFRANAMQLASKIALGYASESQAKQLGYSKSEWLKFVTGKNKAESRWYSLGGKKSYFKTMIMNSRGAKVIGLKGFDGIEGTDLGELGIAPAVIAAVVKVFGAVIGFFKKLKLKKKQAAQNSAQAHSSSSQKSATAVYPSSTSTATSFNDGTRSMNTDKNSGVTEEVTTDENGKKQTIYKDKEGKEIGKFKALFLKHKKIVIIVAVVTVVGIIALIIWKMRQNSLSGLGAAGLSKKQENFIRRQGLNNRAYGSLIREEISNDGKRNNKSNRKVYYKKVFREAFSRPISQKQVSATLNHNDRLKQVRALAKKYGKGSEAWRKAWAEVKKKS